MLRILEKLLVKDIKKDHVNWDTLQIVQNKGN